VFETRAFAEGRAPLIDVRNIGLVGGFSWSRSPANPGRRAFDIFECWHAVC